MGGVAASIAALGNGVGDGDIGVIRVSQGGDTVEVLLYWDALAAKWISVEVMRPIISDDGDWAQQNRQNLALSWAYIGNKNTGDDLGKTLLRAGGIPCAGALIAAGLQLQDRMSAHMHDNASVQMYLAAWFYEYNDADVITFDNDASSFAGKTWNGLAADTYGFQPSSANIGHGCVLTKAASAATRKYANSCQYEDNITSSGYHGLARGADWDYVKFFTATQPVGSALGGVPTSTPYTPVKKYIYPTLYGYGAQANSQGWADITYELRWTS